MTGAGDLRESVHFQQPTESDDGFGTIIVGPPETVFTTAARIQILRGGETVIAGRLAGRQTVAITVRWQSEFDDIDSTWRAVNARTGAIYNIKSVEPNERRSFVNILTETE